MKNKCFNSNCRIKQFLFYIIIVSFVGSNSYAEELEIGTPEIIEGNIIENEYYNGSISIGAPTNFNFSDENIDINYSLDGGATWKLVYRGPFYLCSRKYSAAENEYENRFICLKNLKYHKGYSNKMYVSWYETRYILTHYITHSYCAERNIFGGCRYYNYDQEPVFKYRDKYHTETIDMNGFSKYRGNGFDAKLDQTSTTSFIINFKIGKLIFIKEIHPNKDIIVQFKAINKNTGNVNFSCKKIYKYAEPNIGSEGSILYKDGFIKPDANLYISIDLPEGYYKTLQLYKRISKLKQNDECETFIDWAPIGSQTSQSTQESIITEDGFCYQFKYNVINMAGNHFEYAPDAIVKAINHPPSLSDISDQHMNENTEIKNIVINAVDSDGDPITIVGKSSNTALLPNNNIQIYGSEPDYMLSILPLPDTFGKSIITLTAYDGFKDNSIQFTVFVYPDQGFDFDGKDDYVKIMNHSSLQLTDNITIEAWITPKINNKCIISKIEPNYHGFKIFISKNNKLTFTIGNHNNFFEVDSHNDILLNSWTHIAASYDGSEIRLYINGILDRTVNFSGGFDSINESDLLIGQCTDQLNDDSNVFYKGKIDDLRLWKVCRSEEKIINNMYRRLSGKHIGLSGNWYLKNDCAQDFSEYHNNGIIQTGLPTISDILDVTVVEDKAFNPILFFISDQDSSPYSLTVSVHSSNYKLLPDDNIEVENFGSARIMSITPVANMNGKTEISVSVYDGCDFSKSTFKLNVNPENDVPVAFNQNLMVEEDHHLNIELSGYDVEGDPLSYTIIEQPMHGKLSGNPPVLEYIPYTDFNGIDQFQFTIDDLVSTSNMASVTIHVISVYDFPIAVDQVIITNEDTPVDIMLKTKDVEGDQLTYILVEQPSYGRLTGTDQTVQYIPNDNYNGFDRFRFKVKDKYTESNAATVSIFIKPINDLPLANNTTVITDENIAVAIQLSAVDIDGDKLNYSLNEEPGYGELTGLMPDLIYTPNPNYNGEDRFTFIVNDGYSTSLTATVTITINDVNFAPVAVDDSVIIDEDVATEIELKAIDRDGDQLNYFLTKKPEQGILSGGIPNLIYIPDNNYYGKDTFHFKVNDGYLDSNTARVTIFVKPMNDIPDSCIQKESTYCDLPLKISLNCTDIDNDSLEYMVIQQPLHGKLIGEPPIFTYVPDDKYVGEDDFNYVSNDSYSQSLTSTIQISVLNPETWHIGSSIPMPQMEKPIVKVEIDEIHRDVFLLNNNELFPIYPTTATVKLFDSDGHYVSIKGTSVWPDECQIYILESGDIHLLPETSEYSQVKLIFSENESFVVDNQFYSQKETYSVLQYNINEEESILEVVKSVHWDNKDVLIEKNWNIGASNILELHDPDCGDGTIINYNSDNYVIVWYQKEKTNVCWPYKSVQYDVQPPISLISTSPPMNEWTNQTTVDLNWSDALCPFSFLVDKTPQTIPSLKPETVVQNMIPLTEGDGEYYIHIRTIDDMINYTRTHHYGPWKVDTVIPENCFVIESTPEISTPINITEIYLSWNKGLDERSGINSYYWAVDQFSENETIDFMITDSLPTTINLMNGDGDYYIHCKIRDNANNFSSITHYGPWKLDTTPPENPIISSSQPVINQLINTSKIDLEWLGDHSQENNIKVYVWEIDQSQITIPKENVKTELPTTIYLKEGLGKYYLHIKAVDHAGNHSKTFHYGPWMTKTVYSMVVPDTEEFTDTTEIFGEDSDYRINLPSYTKLDDKGNILDDSATEWSIVRDNVTGLLWEVKNKDNESIHDIDSKCSQNYAQKFFINNINNSQLCGYQDWRIPTIKELASLSKSIGGFISIKFFPQGFRYSKGEYWSSHDSIIFDYSDCNTSFFYPSYMEFHVRAVRSNQDCSKNQYIINGDGTVTDTTTGLMWQRSGFSQKMNWEESINACENLRFANFFDWRLPTKEELRSIVRYSKRFPAINSNYFMGQPDTYWSSTPFYDLQKEKMVDGFWINFHDADESYYFVDNDSGKSLRKTRAVRGGQHVKSDCLYIHNPKQASVWIEDELMLISWESQQITGNLKISISRTGGQKDSFETIAEKADNNGNYEWKVKGPVSARCVLKIEPLNNASKGTEQSFFTITTFDNPIATIVGTPLTVSNESKLTLTVEGKSVNSYKYKLDNNEYSNDYHISQPIHLNNLKHGKHKLSVLGRDASGKWQNELAPTIAVWNVELPVITIKGIPDTATSDRSLCLTFCGNSIVEYKYEVLKRSQYTEWSMKYSNTISENFSSITLTDLYNGDEYKVIVTGKKGNGQWLENDQAIGYWRIDKKAPVIYGLQNSATPTKSKTFKWTANEPSMFRFWIDQDNSSSPIGEYGNITCVSLQGINEKLLIQNIEISDDGFNIIHHQEYTTSGYYYLHVQAKDSAGNESNVKTVSANLDFTTFQPVLHLDKEDYSGFSYYDSYTYHKYITNKTSGLTISGKCEQGSTIKIFLNCVYINDSKCDILDDNDSDSVFEYDISLSPNKIHIIEAKQIDLRNNISELSKPLNIWVDTIHPTLKFISPTDKQYLQQLQIVEINASDNTGIYNLEVQISGNKEWLAADQKKDKWEINVNHLEFSDATDYTLTARATDYGGNISYTSITFTFGKELSFVTCNLLKNDILLGEPIELTGTILSSNNSTIKNINSNVIIFLQCPNNQKIFKAKSGIIHGKFHHVFNCTSLSPKDVFLTPGDWEISVEWEGNEIFEDSISKPAKLKINKTSNNLSLNMTPKGLIKTNETISYSGKLTPVPDCCGGLPLLPISIKVQNLESSESIDLTGFTNPCGYYSFKNLTTFNSPGKWSVQSFFAGNSSYSQSCSELLYIDVVETAGYAIIVQGSSEASHDKTADFVYESLIKRGLTDDDIYYLTWKENNSSEDIIIDDKPYKENIQSSISGINEYANLDQKWSAINKMNHNPSNLYIILLDHGSEDKFYISDQSISSSDNYITPIELSLWLNELYSGLSENARDQELFIILGFCNSGSFIDELSLDNRIIITSSAKDELSFKGPFDDSIRHGEFFIYEFFKQVQSGASVRSCFIEATHQVEIYTSSILEEKTCRQHPQLDDNGDKLGSNDIANSKTDGLISESLYIGLGTESLYNDLLLEPKLTVPDILVMASDQECIDITASVINAMEVGATISTIWVEIKPPGYKPEQTIKNEQMTMNLPHEVYDNNIDNNTFIWNCLGNSNTSTTYQVFNESGTYQVYYFAIDNNTGKSLPIYETTLYKTTDNENSPPTKISLHIPENLSEKTTTLYFDWEDAIDPEHHRFTYTLLISKDNPSFNDSQTIRKNGLFHSNYFIHLPDKGVNTWDGSVVYWKVMAIDEYGDFSESEVWSFHTDNLNNTYEFRLELRVFDDSTKQPLQMAKLYKKLKYDTKEPEQENIPSNGLYTNEIPMGSYDLTVSAKGYTPGHLSFVVFQKNTTLIKELFLKKINKYFIDSDSDNYGNSDVIIQSCAKPEGFVNNYLDCNDADKSVNPEAVEICNGKDDNCNNLIDEDVLNTFYKDSDQDGYGNPEQFINSCFPPDGYVLDSTDINDLDKNIPFILIHFDMNGNGSIELNDLIYVLQILDIMNIELESNNSKQRYRLKDVIYLLQLLSGNTISSAQ